MSSFDEHTDFHGSPLIVPRARAVGDFSSKLKRPINSFLLFSQAKRKILREKYPHLQNSEISRMLGHMWKNMTEEERRPFVMKANSIKERFEKENPTYKYKGRSSREGEGDGMSCCGDFFDIEARDEFPTEEFPLRETRDSLRSKMLMNLMQINIERSNNTLSTAQAISVAMKSFLKATGQLPKIPETFSERNSKSSSSTCSSSSVSPSISKEDAFYRLMKSHPELLVNPVGSRAGMPVNNASTSSTSTLFHTVTTTPTQSQFYSQLERGTEEEEQVLSVKVAQANNASRSVFSLPRVHYATSSSDLLSKDTFSSFLEDSNDQFL